MTRIAGIDPRSGRPIEILVRDGLIAEIRSASSGNGLYVSPRLVDLQVNGFGGADLNESDLRPETVLQFIRLHRTPIGVRCKT